MKAARLTRRTPAATTPLMRTASGTRWGKWVLPVLAGPIMLGGCINVTAPAEPIVIELNINIRQEVIYRLAEDAGNTIEENADIF
jgi:hypothetical protein